MKQLGVNDLVRGGGGGGVQLVKEIAVHQPRVWKRIAGGRGAGRQERGENKAIKKEKGKKRDRRREGERNKRTGG